MSNDSPHQPRFGRLHRLRKRMLARAEQATIRPLDAEHPLAKAVGLEEARAILFPQPTPLQARWAERRAVVAQRIAEGIPIKQIARELGVSPTRIRQLRKAIGL